MVIKYCSSNDNEHNSNKDNFLKSTQYIAHATEFFKIKMKLMIYKFFR